MIKEIVGRLVRAYKGEFVFVEIVDSNPSVDTVLQLKNQHGLLEITEKKSAASDVAIKLQNGLYASYNKIQVPRDSTENDIIFKERTAGEGWLKTIRAGANDYELYLKRGAAWHRIGADIGCRVYHSLLNVIATGTWTALTFNSELYDTDTIHDPASNPTRLTCNTAGKYSIAGHVTFAEDDPAVGYRAVAIRVNGSTVIAKQDREQGNINPSFSIPTLYNLAVDDYVELIVYQSSGGNLAITPSAQWSPHFAMQMISG